MLDFISALYLGPRVLPPPPGLVLSTGRPAALGELDQARQVAQAVARRQGLAAGALAPSTLHLFHDVFQLMPANGVLLLERRLYPVGQWGSQQARLRGLLVAGFEGLASLRKLLLTYQQQGRTPWLVADGYHPGRGPAPLARYYAALAACPGAVLLLDDTQAFGVLGGRPTAAQPLGQGGGGSLVRAALVDATAGPELLTITSLAKGLGVPVAVLAGRTARLRQFAHCSDTRVHTSPVSAWHAWAAAQALHLDAHHGQAARASLGRHIRQFRVALGQVGLRPAGGWFPVQKLVPARATAALSLHQQLRQAGINTLLLAGEHQPGVPEIAFCLRADHAPAAITQVARVLRRAVRHNPDWFSPVSLLSACHEPDLLTL